MPKSDPSFNDLLALATNQTAIEKMSNAQVCRAAYKYGEYKHKSTSIGDRWPLLWFPDNARPNSVSSKERAAADAEEKQQEPISVIKSYGTFG